MDENAEKVQMLREWISKQPHFPQKNHVNLLRRFLHCSNDSIELAKQLADLFYTLRSETPEIYYNRDPTNPEIKEAINSFDFLPLPKRTKDNYQVFLYRLTSSDPEKYDFINASKVFSMVADVRMVEDNDIADGEIPIFDISNFTPKHVTRIVLSVMKKILIYSQEAHPMKLRQVHYINASSFFTKFMAILKPFIKSDILNTLHFHPPNSETLFDYVPKELLPDEYGGLAGKCEDIKKLWLDNLIKWKDYLTDDEYWNVDESKRPAGNRNKPSEQFGLQGSFKSLSID